MVPSLLVSLDLVVGTPAGKEPAKRDSQSIVGEWVGEKAVSEGMEKPVPEGGVTMTFTADGKFLVREGKRERAEEGTYKADAKKDPAEIDIMPLSEKAGRGTIRGIFKVEGDTLTLCFTVGKDDASRPAKFESPAGSGAMLITLGRAKKD